MPPIIHDGDASEPLLAAANELNAAIQRACINRRFDGSTLQRLGDVLVDHRARWKHKGLDFPVMVPLVLPSLRYVELLRADLDHPQLQLRILRILKDHGGVLSAQEVATAVRAAFPSYDPVREALDEKLKLIRERAKRDRLAATSGEGET